MTTLICESCRTEFRVAPSHAANKTNGSPRRFCSWACRQTAMRGASAPNSGKGQKIRGAANPRWNGGQATARRSRHQEAEVAQWRRRVFHRDGYRCRRCGLSPKTRNQLRAHHRAPWATNPDQRFDVDNGVTLCRYCHDWVHSPANVAHEFLA